MTVIHVALETALQAQPAGAVTLVVSAPPAAATDALDPESANVHTGGGAAAPAWSTVNVCPPIERVLLRADVLAFAATEKTTVPSPVPDAPLVTETHDALD